MLVVNDEPVTGTPISIVSSPPVSVASIPVTEKDTSIFIDGLTAVAVNSIPVGITFAVPVTDSIDPIDDCNC